MFRNNKILLSLILAWLILILTGCSNSLGDCSTTCYSKSTDTNLGTDGPYSDYTKEECEELKNNRQTILTNCTYTWDEY